MIVLDILINAYELYKKQLLQYVFHLTIKFKQEHYFMGSDYVSQVDRRLTEQTESRAGHINMIINTI